MIIRLKVNSLKSSRSQSSGFLLKKDFLLNEIVNKTLKKSNEHSKEKVSNINLPFININKKIYNKVDPSSSLCIVNEMDYKNHIKKVYNNNKKKNLTKFKFPLSKTKIFSSNNVDTSSKDKIFNYQLSRNINLIIKHSFNIQKKSRNNETYDSDAFYYTKSSNTKIDMYTEYDNNNFNKYKYDSYKTIDNNCLKIRMKDINEHKVDNCDIFHNTSLKRILK